MKLWEKDNKTEKQVLEFTVGNDPSFDKLLAPYDIIASIAHASMLGSIRLISSEEMKQLKDALFDYFPEVCKPGFHLNPDDEDIHSHLESYLISKLGDTGKKIHTARSRNDQVLIALQLLMKEEIRIIIKEVNVLFQTLVSQAGRYKDILIPGYTHTQVAMPSSFALWLGAYAESLVSDLKLFEGIIKLIDQSTLGSAAGYGSSFPIDRDLTKKLLGFGDIMVSSVSAQLARGKMESTVAFGLGSFAATLSRLSTDMILFMSQDMNFISFPEELTTGSSIMPHKKNPDVLELIRAHANILIQMPSLLNGLSSNLLSGYHRDFQLTKEILIPGFGKLRQCLAMSGLMLSNMLPRSGIIEDEKYRYLFSVEQVNKKVMEGKSFRDAYMEVAEEIKQGNYKHGSYCEYTHIGSIGNPGLDRIKVKMETALKTVNIKPIDEIFEDLKRL